MSNLQTFSKPLSLFLLFNYYRIFPLLSMVFYFFLVFFVLLSITSSLSAFILTVTSFLDSPYWSFKINFKSRQSHINREKPFTIGINFRQIAINLTFLIWSMLINTNPVKTTNLLTFRQTWWWSVFIKDYVFYFFTNKW